MVVADEVYNRIRHAGMTVEQIGRLEAHLQTVADHCLARVG
ncbi:MAG TPA: hypothetical protein VLB51_12900 [Methylomirabilota bacterium]|nr:hypothetical protein [Methylomirabilota bacterium]